MTRRKLSYSEMVANGIRYLNQNTDITYFGDGSIARALVEATALEISRLQSFVSSNINNSFLSTATGLSLDLFGEMLGVPRIRERRAQVDSEDQTVRFYSEVGTLSAQLSNVTTQSTVIPEGTTVKTVDGSLTFLVSQSVSFGINAKQVFVPVIANSFGSAFNVGANQLTSHSLGTQGVKVTNDFPITSGSDVEPDEEYRYRLSKAMTTRFGSNTAAITVAALSQPGISSVQLNQFARGAGTFDVLLIPQGNKVSQAVKENTLRAVETVTAFGISPRVKEPSYVRFKLIIKLRFDRASGEGQRTLIKRQAETAILSYFGNIRIGGEMIVNQLRSQVLNISRDIVDLQILEFCINGKPKTIRNFRLSPDEIFIPDNEIGNPVEVI